MGKLKFGDGSTNFKRNKFSEHSVDAKGPMLYTSPAKQGFMDILGGDGLGGESKTKDIKAPDADKKVIKIDESKTEKVEPKKLDIVTENPETGKREKVGETNTSSRPEGTEAVTKTPEEAGMHEAKDTKTMGGIQKEESKPEKKSLWQRFKDHHDSGEAMKVEAHFRDAAAVIAGDGRKDGSELHKQYAQNIKDKETAQLATKTKTEQDAKDLQNAKQKQEMHESQLAVNQAKITEVESMKKAREHKIKIQEEANAGENDAEATDATAPNIIEGSGTATSTINDENKKKENQSIG